MEDMANAGFPAMLLNETHGEGSAVKVDSNRRDVVGQNACRRTLQEADEVVHSGVVSALTMHRAASTIQQFRRVKFAVRLTTTPREYVLRQHI
ncbi:hypothetical protein SAPIO_CDS0734 [Scedosporium apiospermum]|uniref:Uncharacterized protein n=1 Tax=Pseudallescheria apiosperma TaxID=563466 RepID=A0A084GGE9_PSEDA|nr:uncharacterized protein SAPIO_CDS0734 [Scedosporium apiospermum]KEZ46411.1 hypothetical protein SAPIO_CDS0734 [Scedosporium apiospermum]